MTYEDIINAPNSDALVDILFRIKGMHKSLWRRELSLHEIFKKSDEFCNQTGIKLPEKMYAKVKNEIKRSYFNEHINVYCHARFFEDDFENLDYNNRITFPNISCSAQSNYEKVELECDESMRYGILLVWCGAAVSILSDGILAPYGAIILGTGAGWISQAVLNKSTNEKQYQRELAEEVALKAKKKAKKAAKKEEKRRKKELAKQKEKEEQEKRLREKNERRKHNTLVFI